MIRTSVILPTHFRKSDCEESSTVATEYRRTYHIWKLRNLVGRSISGSRVPAPRGRGVSQREEELSAKDKISDVFQNTKPRAEI